MEFKMEVDEFLGLIDVSDLQKVVEVSKAVCRHKKTADSLTTQPHLNGTK